MGKEFIDRGVVVHMLMNIPNTSKQTFDVVCGAPAEDVVPVVRCEHCQSYDHGYCPTLKTRMDPCDYCSYGRKDENGTEKPIP